MARSKIALYTPETLKIVYRAFNDCLVALEAVQPSDEKARTAYQLRLAQAILRAVAQGELDPEVLKGIGLKSVGQLSKSNAGS